MNVGPESSAFWDPENWTQEAIRNREAERIARLDEEVRLLRTAERDHWYHTTDGRPMFFGGEAVHRTIPRLRHIHMLGATGSGKTNKLLKMIDKDLARTSRVCLIDLRGDLIDRILLRAAALPDFDRERLCLIDLRDDQNVVGFNPLSGPGDIHSRAYHILGVIKHHADGWGVQIDESIRNALVLLVEQGQTLLELETLFTNQAFRRGLVSQTRDPYVRSFFERYENLSSEKQLAWTLPVLNKITPYLAMPRLRRVLGADKCIDLSYLLKKRGSIVLIGLAVDRLHEAAHLLGGLFVSAIQHVVMSRADLPEAQRPRVFLTIDEFEVMASSAFEQIIAEGRRFGLGLTLAHQSLSQLSPSLKSSIRANAYTSYFFGMGAEDAADIAREVPGRTKVEDWRGLLQTLRLGDYLMVQRGEKPLLGHTDYIPDPEVSPERLSELKEASHARFAQSAEVVDAAFEARISSTLRYRPSNARTDLTHGKSPNLPF